MSSSLIRGKYLIGRVIDNDRVEVIEDGAIFQRDGKIVNRLSGELGRRMTEFFGGCCQLKPICSS